MKIIFVLKLIMKNLFFIIVLLLPVNFVQADISKLEVNGQIRYFSTLVDDLGERYDDTRSGPALDLHFTYPINKNIKANRIFFTIIILI